MSKELRAKIKKRCVQLKKGDKVRVMRGSFKKKEGKVTRVDLKRSVAFVEGVVRKKQSGKEVQAAIQASKLLIIELAGRAPKRKALKEQAPKQAPKEQKTEQTAAGKK